MHEHEHEHEHESRVATVMERFAGRGQCGGWGVVSSLTLWFAGFAGGLAPESGIVEDGRWLVQFC